MKSGASMLSFDGLAKASRCLQLQLFLQAFR